MPATFSLSLTHSPLQQLAAQCSFLFSFPIVPLCLQQVPQQFVAFVMVLRDVGTNLRNTGQLLWQPCPPQTTIFNILRIFLILCRLQGNKAEEKNYFKARMLPKGITIRHRASFSYQKDDDVDVLSKKKSWLQSRRRGKGAWARGFEITACIICSNAEWRSHRLTSFCWVYSQYFLIGIGVEKLTYI